MEQPLRNSLSSSKEIPRLSWNSKVHYCVHKGPPSVLILSQIHPVHTFPPYFPKIQYIVIFPSAPRSSEWSLYSRFCDQNVFLISHAFYMSRPSDTPWLDHCNCSWWSVQLWSFYAFFSSLPATQQTYIVMRRPAATLLYRSEQQLLQKSGWHFITKIKVIIPI